MSDDAQRADHFKHLYHAASEGKCGHSGLPLAICKASICDCFEFPWVEPDQAAADKHFGVERRPPVLCPGCNVREPWEHRCCAPDEPCDCSEPACMERQGHTIDWAKLMKGT